MWWHNTKEIKELKESIPMICDRMSQLDMKIDEFLQQSDKVETVLLSEKTLDKLDDCLKNVDKLNSMINEFKGCVSIARAAISDKKEMDQMRTILENMIKTCQTYYNRESNLERCLEKIDAIYGHICQKQEKKSPKKKKSIKKGKTTPVF